MIAKRVTEKSNPLTVDEILINLNLRLESWNEKKNEEK
jgi:hypothetical protein